MTREPLFESLKLLPPTDARLNSVSREISGTDFRKGLVEKVGGVMLEIAMEQRAERRLDQPTLVGLAAPQIGAFVRMILWDTEAQAGQPNPDPKFRLMINPRLLRVSQQEGLDKEACYSTGDIRALVYRATSLTVGGVDAHNHSVYHHVDDPFQARIIQHEVDHLNGIRCPDRVRSPGHLLPAAQDTHGLMADRESREYPATMTNWLDTKQGRGLQ